MPMALPGSSRNLDPKDNTAKYPSLMKSSTTTSSRTRGIQSQHGKAVEPMDRAVKRRRKAALLLLDEDGYLVRLCRKAEWKELRKLLSFMLKLLQQNEGASLSGRSRATATNVSSSYSVNTDDHDHNGTLSSTSDRGDIVQKVRRQLLAQDSNGNNCLHLVCYLKPPSYSRILPLLFQVARAADGVNLSLMRNHHDSTALQVACSYRFSQPLIPLLLEHGDVSLEAILACDWQGRTPFTGLIQCYRLLSKIPSFRNRYIDLETVNASVVLTTGRSNSGKLEPLDFTDNEEDWDEDRRGSFPLLWYTCTNLLRTGWHNTFPGTPCPSILHGAALVAPAMPPLLIDVVLRCYGCCVGSSTLRDLIELVIHGTTVALAKACPLTHSMYQNQALHFVRKLLHFQSQQAEPCDKQPVLSECFHKAIKAGLTWHVLSDTDRDTGDEAVDQQHDNSASSLSSHEGGYKFDSSGPLTNSKYPTMTHVTKSAPEYHDTNPIGWLQVLLTLSPDALQQRDGTFGLFPFQLAALPQRNRLDYHKSEQGRNPDLTLDRFQVDTIYNLLLACPDVIKT